MVSMEKIWARVMNLVTRARVDRSDDSTTVPQPQVIGLGGKPRKVEVFQPQGLYFRAPAGAEGVRLSTPGGDMLVAAQDRTTWPAGTDVSEGEGGLHYMGTWLVFLDSDGVLHLGTQEGESLIPRDDRVQAELARLKGELDDAKSDIQALKDAWGGTPVANDGGAALKTFATGALASVPTLSPADPGDTAAQNVKTT